jgi:hypothetical protein
MKLLTGKLPLFWQKTLVSAGLLYLYHICIERTLMKRLIFPILLCLASLTSAAAIDTVAVPLQRQLFHDAIQKEQLLCDRADGKEDGLIKVSGNDEVNLQVTDALIRKVNELEDSVETNPKLVSNNDKVRNLKYIQLMLQTFRLKWRAKLLNPSLAPELVDVFTKVLFANIDSSSMAPYLANASYDVGRIIFGIFDGNVGYEDSKKVLFVRYCAMHPDEIMSIIGPYINDPIADSLIVIATRNNPVQLYSYAQSTTREGLLIHRSKDPLVRIVTKLSQTPDALLYFPFLDNILKGKITIDSIKRYVGEEDNAGERDTIGYYKLLVRTEIEYSSRLIAKDTPIAMFGSNGLRDMLQRKALEHFINWINALHEEQNLSVRMRAINQLSAKDLYYMIVMGENDIYTSSYKHSYERLVSLMGKKPRGDSLLMSVNMDYFKKFIKMAANYNQLDDFLQLMPKANSEILMKAFVDNLDNNSGSLEDAVDVADSYSSIKNKLLLKAMLDNVTANEKRSISANNNNGKIIYGLLKTIFLSEDSSNHIDLTKAIGIPPIYSVDYNYVADDSGRVIEQVFFYGDKDGKGYFQSFINSFPTKEWKITMSKEWAEIKSLKGKPIWIFANRPLDNDANLDDSAQIHLTDYFNENDLNPSIVIHRGHSYWLPRTIERMPADAKIVILGSCGGYRNLKQILSVSPDAHIISTKEIGKGDINMPILSHVNDVLLAGKTIVWKDMWASLTKLFAKDPNREVRESWDDYVPPYKNLGAIFIKAYNIKLLDLSEGN